LAKHQAPHRTSRFRMWLGRGEPREQPSRGTVEKKRVEFSGKRGKRNNAKYLRSVGIRLPKQLQPWKRKKGNQKRLCPGEGEKRTGSGPCSSSTEQMISLRRPWGLKQQHQPHLLGFGRHLTREGGESKSKSVCEIAKPNKNGGEGKKKKND